MIRFKATFAKDCCHGNTFPVFTFNFVGSLYKKTHAQIVTDIFRINLLHRELE